MFTRLFFLAAFAVLVVTQVFSSGIFIPRLIHQTKIERPFQQKVPEIFVFKITVGDKGEVKSLVLKGCVDKTGIHGWDVCPSDEKNRRWVQVIQKEVIKNWKYEPKEKFVVNIQEFRLDVSDENFRPLKPRR